jgi:hypothetical protein
MRRYQKILLIFLAVGHFSFGADEDGYNGTLHYNNQDPDQLTDAFTEAAGYFGSIQMTTVRNCNCGGPFRIPEDPQCFNRYSKIYDNGKPTVDLTIALGHSNSEDGAWASDPYYREELSERISTPCPKNAEKKNIFLCGFDSVGSGKDASFEVFEKPISTPSGHKKILRITLTNASGSSIQAENEADPLSGERAQKAQAIFERALCGTGGMAIEAGHGRYGYGYDFDAPVMKNGKVDVAYYKNSKKTNLARMESILKNCPPDQRAAFVSLFGCRYRGFSEAFRRAAPETGYQLSTEFGWPVDWAYELYGTLNGLVGQICEPGLTQSINANYTDASGRVRKTDPTGRMIFYNW